MEPDMEYQFESLGPILRIVVLCCLITFAILAREWWLSLPPCLVESAKSCDQSPVCGNQYLRLTGFTNWNSVGYWPWFGMPESWTNRVLRFTVQQIKLFCPTLGKAKITDMLAMAGMLVGSQCGRSLLKAVHGVHLVQVPTNIRRSHCCLG